MADYEKELHRPKIAVLLSAINTENKIIKISEKYNIKLTKEDKTDNNNGNESKVVAICKALLRLYPELNEHIELEKLSILCKCRNKIAHEDELYYIDSSGNKVNLSKTDANKLVNEIKDFIYNRIPVIENFLSFFLKFRLNSLICREADNCLKCYQALQLTVYARCFRLF